MVKDINPGTADGIDSNSVSYAYTSSYLFFAANDGTNGSELWKTDGTWGGTTLVKDINPNAGDASPKLTLVSSGILFFTATDGDDANHTDLFVVDGLFNALPVKLTAFTAAENGPDALLTWRTAQESNTRDFTLERSFDAVNFREIGNVAAAGNSSNTNVYTFLDKGILKSGRNVLYYRLITNDLDGGKEKSPVITLKLRGGSQWNVKLLSNPVRENVNILLEDVKEKLEIAIVDISGKILLHQTLPATNGQVAIPAQLESGTYLLVIKSRNERKVLRFIK